VAQLGADTPEPTDDGEGRKHSPALRAFLKQFAVQHRLVKQALKSPGMKAMLDQVAQQQRRINEALGSPGFRAAVDHAIEQQERLRKALESPGMRAAISHAAEQQERLRKALDSPGFKAMTDQFVEQQRRINEALNSPGFRAAMDQALEQQRRIREALGPDAFREAMVRAAEAFRVWDEGERRLLDMLAPRGWVISPSSSVADLSRLVAVADDHGVEAAEAALIAELNPERCRSIIEGLYARPSFAAWRVPLDQALTAHRQGLYSLSVPIWLIALDGIFLTELGVDRVFSRVHRQDGNALRRHFESSGSARLLEALIDAIQVVAEHIPAGASPTPGELRRNAVLHGLDPDFGTEKASVRGVLLLEVLHFPAGDAYPPRQRVRKTTEEPFGRERQGHCLRPPWG
jgi:hypothetical protein